MISFQCPACQKVLKVAGNSAGKTAPCPNCGQRLLVTPPIKAAQPAARPFPAPDLTDAAGAGDLVMLAAHARATHSVSRCLLRRPVCRWPERPG
jgi:DNA-directed RNA polymerase subunit RPC12/RpoP